MPEFEIHPSNLRRHKKKKNKQTDRQTNKSNRTKFTYVRIKTWFSRLRYQQENLESSLKDKQVKKGSESFHCVLQVTWTNCHLVLVEKWVM